MSYNTKQIKRDQQNSPIPQYYNSTTDVYEPLLGRNGANRVEIYGPDGNHISVINNKLAVRASEIENIIGEVQETPSENTVLARLRSLEDKIDGIVDGTTPATTQLTGSYVGYSTDEKPTITDYTPGTEITFLELDTGNVYVYDGDGNWVVI